MSCDCAFGAVELLRLDMKYMVFLQVCAVLCWRRKLKCVGRGYVAENLVRGGQQVLKICMLKIRSGSEVNIYYLGGSHYGKSG
jgi:hypothetical protein